MVQGKGQGLANRSSRTRTFIEDNYTGGDCYNYCLLNNFKLYDYLNDRRNSEEVYQMAADDKHDTAI